MYKINIHEKLSSKKRHHENDPKVLAKGFQPRHTITLQLLLFPICKLNCFFFQSDGIVCQYSVYVAIF